MRTAGVALLLAMAWVLPVRAAEPPPGFTEGVWIRKYPGNYAAFRLEAAGGVRVVTDPYAMDETVSADVVTESHQDADHVDTSRLAAGYALLTGPGEYQAGGARITGFPGKHNKGDAGPTNTIFVLELGGIRIAHFGSQGAPLAEEALAALGRVDVLLIQGTEAEFFRELKLTGEDCRRIVDRLHPRIVIPEHGSPRLGEYLARRLGGRVEYAPAEGIVVRRRDVEGSGPPRIVDMDRP